MTLIEILVAVGIIGLLSAGLFVVGSYVETQIKVKQTQATIHLLVTALEQYRDFYKKFPFVADANYARTDLNSDIGYDVVNSNGVQLASKDYNDVFASDDSLIYFLDKSPDSKKIIDSMNHKIITNKGNKGNPDYFIKLNPPSNEIQGLMHIVDSWNTPFQYTYKTGDNFPIITSAGPDKLFGNRDKNKTYDHDPANSKDNISSKGL